MRKGCVIGLVIVALLAACGVLVYRNGVDARLVLWIVKASWDRTHDLDATVRADARVLGFKLSGTGRLRHLKPDQYDLDFNNARLVAGKQNLWVIVPAMRTALRVTPGGITPAELLTKLVSGWDSADPARLVDRAVSDPSEVTLYAPQVINGQRCWILDFPARTGQSIGGRLYVGQVSRAPVRFDQMDSTGKVVRTCEISKFRRNTGLKDPDFEYKPMPDYTVIDCDYDPNDPAGIGQMLDQLAPQADELRRKIQEEAGKYLPPEVRQWFQ